MSHCSVRPVAHHSRDSTDDEWRTWLVYQPRPTSRVWGQTINVLSQIVAMKECCVNGRQDASEELRALDSCARGRLRGAGGCEEVTCVWVFLFIFVHRKNVNWKSHTNEFPYLFMARVAHHTRSCHLSPFRLCLQLIATYNLAVFITSLSVNDSRVSCKVSNI